MSTQIASHPIRPFTDRQPQEPRSHWLVNLVIAEVWIRRTRQGGNRS